MSIGFFQFCGDFFHDMSDNFSVLFCVSCTVLLLPFSLDMQKSAIDTKITVVNYIIDLLALLLFP